MMTYADTSILAAAIFEEFGSMAARDWFKRTREHIIVSDLAGLEFAAVISRAERTRRFDNDAAARALASFDEVRAASLPMGHGRGDFELAEKLARDIATKLSAPDALHLASAKNAGAALATCDARLAEAARAQGMEVALASRPAALALAAGREGTGRGVDAMRAPARERSVECDLPLRRVGRPTQPYVARYFAVSISSISFFRRSFTSALSVVPFDWACEVSQVRTRG
jgi:uncharacterized protein